MTAGSENSGKRKKLLIILPSFPALSETFLYTTIENLEQAGFEVGVAARYHGRAPHAPAFADRVRFLPIEKRNPLIKALLVMLWAGQYALRDYRDAKRLAGFVRQSEPTLKNCVNLSYRLLPLLLFDADITYFAFGGLAAKYLEYIHFNQKPSFFSLRGSEINIEPLLHERYRSRLKEALSSAAGVHCVCEDIELKARALAGEPRVNSRVIYTAINPIFLSDESAASRGEGLAGEGLRIISAGRLDWRKGFEHGMMAIREVLDKGANVRWDIYGSGKHEVCLQWAIRDMGLGEHVFIHAGVDQNTLKEKLKASDVYFHPAVHEGVSNSTLEAMACGLPVVACNVGGMAEAVDDGVNGLLTAARDWHAMADALYKLTLDEKLREQIGNKAREDCRKRFSPEKQKAGFESFFNQTLQVIA